MSFLDDEIGVETSQPRELYEIVHGATTYRIANGDRDLVVGGVTYTAAPAARSELKIQTATADVEVEVTLPASHPLAQRYVRMASPPRQILTTIRRLQLTSGEVQQLWVGYVTSVAFVGHLAKLRVPSRTQQTMQRRLPTVLVDTLCQAILYDGWCRVARASFVVETTASAVDGRTITVVSVGGHPDQWFQFGELVHLATGERMTVLSHVGSVLTIQAPIAEMLAGDAVELAAGCAHDSITCRDKFANMVNYVGLPQRPTRDLFLPTGLGTIEQA